MAQSTYLGAKDNKMATEDGDLEEASTATATDPKRRTLKATK